MNKIVWNKKAKKQLARIPVNFRRAIVLAVDGLTDLETCVNVKAMVNHRYGFRLRVGCCRVFFDHDNIVKIVWRQEVKKRDERTY